MGWFSFFNFASEVDSRQCAIHSQRAQEL